MRRALPLGVAIIAAAGIAAPGASAASRTAVQRAFMTARHEHNAFFDIRSGAVQRRIVAPLQTAAQQTLRHTLGRQVSIAEDPLTATPRAIFNLAGSLSGPARGPAKAVALAWVRTHLTTLGLDASDLDGLRLTYDYRSPDGVTHLIWVQTAGGIPAFDNAIRVSVARDGRVLAFSGSPLHGLRVPRAPALLTRAAARLAALKLSGYATAIAAPDDYVKPVLFNRGNRVARAFLVHVSPTSTASLRVVIDARSGALLWRTNDVKWASGLAWDYYPAAPGPGGVAKSRDFSQWLSANDKLVGPNTHVFLDLNDDNREDPQDEIAPSGGNWNYPYTPVPSPLGNCPTAGCTWDHLVPDSYAGNEAQNSTQVFYFLNHYHDHLAAAPISFTRAAGNFEGDDPVMANTLDGANSGHVFIPNPLTHADNANMGTSPDGTSPRMQMYLFEPLPPPFNSDGLGYPFADVNGGDDASVIYHEYTHGLTNRLVIDSTGGGALDTPQAGAMGEAWSDWYAMDFIVAQGFASDDPNKPGELHEGGFTDGNNNLIRTMPIDCPVGAPASACPRSGGEAGNGGYTYEDFGKVIGSPEVHADGEIWGQTLWDLRQRLGSTRTEELVTRALSLSPPQPTFLDMRNSILAADTATGGKDHAAIWEVFAHRGMGFFASTSGGDDAGPVADTSLPPPAKGPVGTVVGLVTDPTGAPVPYAHVALGGHGSGLDNDLAADADKTGHYKIANVPAGKYDSVVFGGDGYSPATSSAITVTPKGTTTVPTAKITRDWALLSGGSLLVGRKGQDTGGCGPGGSLDGIPSTGWEAYAPQNSFDPGPKSFTVKLPTPVDVTKVGLDPGPSCFDNPGSQTGAYQLEVSRDGSAWSTVSDSTFDSSAAHKQALVDVPAAAQKSVRFLRLTVKSDLGTLTSVMADPTAILGDTADIWVDFGDVNVYGTSPDKNAPKLKLRGKRTQVVRAGRDVTIRGTASDDVALRKVIIGPAHATIGANGRFTIRTTVPAGRTSLQVTAVDGSGNRTTVKRVVLGDRRKPTIRSAKATRSHGAVVLVLTLKDDTGIASVTVGKRRAKLTGSRARLVLHGATARTLTVKVTDRAGRVTKKRVRVR